MLRNVIAVIIGLSATAFGQGIQLAGGSSSLMNATGAEAKAYFANSETSVGGGVFGKTLYVGVVEKLTFRRLDIEAGDVSLPFRLPTDFVPNNVQFYAVGLSVSKGKKNRMTGFVGQTASSVTLPFFFGAKAATPTAAFFLTRELGSRLTFDSAEIISREETTIQSLTYRPFAPVTLSVAGGVGSNAPFLAGRLHLQTLRWSGTVNYTKRGAAFQRVVLPTQTFVENFGLNAAVAYTGRHFGFSGDHTNDLSGLKHGVVRSTVNSLSGNGSVSIFNFNGSTFFGTSGGMTVRGQTAGVGGTFKMVSVHEDIYRSRFGTQQSTSVSEKLTRHFSVNEFLSGRHSVDFGAEYHTNTVTASVGYSMSFFPVTGQFQKVLSATITLQLRRAMTVSVGTLATPDGKVKWEVSGNKYSQGPLSDIQLGSSHSVGGKYSYSGRVLDTKGMPVTGAAVMLGKTQEVFTNSRGEFVLPTKKKTKQQAVKVIPEDFTLSGRFTVVSSPETMTPEHAVTIVVNPV